MAIKLTSILESVLTVFRTNKNSKYNAAYIDALRTYAKTEYGNDWNYAFNYMLDNDGNGPRMGNTQ